MRHAWLFPHSLLFATALFLAPILNAQPASTPVPRWKGAAVLGNGEVCAVYSDDARFPASTRGGLQHFYYKDFATDYVASTFFTPVSAEQTPVKIDSLGMENFFTATTHRTRGGAAEVLRAFAHPGGAVVLSLQGFTQDFVRFEAALRKTIRTDRITTLTSLRQENNIALATWSNGTTLAIAALRRAEIKLIDSVVSVVLPMKSGDEFSVVIAAASSEEAAIELVRSLKRERNVFISASEYWEQWIAKGIVPVFQDSISSGIYLEAYKRNLYAAKAALLGGGVPADLTGQFVTSAMPQLYPRDAMMCARIFLLTGHAEEAEGIILFWKARSLPVKSKGEWFARYDARLKAVDAGSGARFDEPAWDANGYYLQLIWQYYKAAQVWLAEPQVVYDLADFLVSHLDKNGLLYDGGAAGWSGYLPATNMTCAAALKNASGMATAFGDAKRSAAYLAASEKISGSLNQMFDFKKQTYADVRYAPRKTADNRSVNTSGGELFYLWNTSANFGVLWGYPAHSQIQLTNLFYQTEPLKQQGGLQYFDMQGGEFSIYGRDVFFCTTAAAAEYHSLYGNKATAKQHIDWMLRNANVYGLMPERILLDQSGCSLASPHLWSCAEFAAALFTWSGAK
ncbi:MAG: hypothetical protein IAF08_16365 [Rhizobacter sp.]|nr:hypothetical protein [Chlorobiales bacterium]